MSGLNCLRSLVPLVHVLLTMTCLPLPATAHAQSLPSPEEVLERARASRSEFSDLVFELQAALPDLATKEKMAPYLRILKEMRMIQVELDFAAMDVDMILELADKMTVYIAPQMDITADPEPLLRDFVMWSDDSRITQFCQDQEGIVAGVSGIGEIFRVLDRIATLISVVENGDSVIKRFSHSADDFSRLQARLHERLVSEHLVALTPADYARFLQGVKRVAAIQGGFDTFVEVAYESSDDALLSRVLHMMTLARGRLAQLTEFVPEDVMTRPGVIVGSVIIKAIESGGVLGDEVVSDALGVMYPAQLDALGLGLRSVDTERVRPEQFQMLTRLSRLIADAYRSFNLPTHERLMRDLAARFDLGVKLLEGDFEGVYEIEIEGRPGVFTFARTDNLGVVVSVGYSHITASMAYGSYDRPEDLFQASSVKDVQAPVDSSTGQPDIPLQYARFRITLPGVEESTVSQDSRPRVSGILRIGHKEQRFTGRRISLLRNYLDTKARDAIPQEEFMGSYEGDFLGYKAILKLTTNGSNHVASMVISPETHNNLITLDAVHLDADRQVLYLTSRQRTVFFQVRGHLERGLIRGQFVIGGKRAPIETTFVKSSDDQVE